MCNRLPRITGTVVGRLGIGSRKGNRTSNRGPVGERGGGGNGSSQQAARIWQTGDQQPVVGPEAVQVPGTRPPHSTRPCPVHCSGRGDRILARGDGRVNLMYIEGGRAGSGVRRGRRGGRGDYTLNVTDRG